jgi:hypothetical protein
MAKSEGTTGTEQKIEEFAEDLGRLLGSAQAKAEGWLGQRQQIAATLSGIRDTATSLLSQLTGEGGRVVAAVRRGRRRGRPAGSPNKPVEATGEPTRRKMSAKARKAISRAQKARWAARRASDKKK